MSTNNRSTRYDEDFQHTLVNLYQSGGKTQAALCREYGIAPMTLNRWIKQYSTVEMVFCQENVQIKHVPFCSLSR